MRWLFHGAMWLLLLASTASAATPESPPMAELEGEWAADVLRWIASRTDDTTGLPTSFDPTVDHAMDGQAAIYDLAITAILLAETGRVNSAVRIIDQLEVMWTGRGLPNFVHASLATTGIESVVHTGPNAWVALAADRVWLRGGNVRHLRFAQAIADWIVGRRNQEEGATSAPPWQSLAFGERMVRAPAMGPAAAFSPVGVIVPWSRIVSTEHALDTYALLKLLSADSGVPAKRQSVYRDALAEVAGYLEAAATNPDCHKSAGVHLRANDSGGVCIEMGGEAGKGWDRRFNAADVYYWWVSAIREGEIPGVRSHAEILSTARNRFHQEVNVDGRLIAGTDYFTCTTSPQDHECARREAASLSAPSRGSDSDGGVRDAGLSDGALSDRGSRLGADAAHGLPIPEGVCRLLDVGACGRNAKAPDPEGFSLIGRTQAMVSVEWTGEAILANRLIAGSAEDAGAYARDLLASMQRLETSVGVVGARRVSLPYATTACGCVFDGGWLTPAEPVDHSGLPGALAGTVWVAFARLGINPFRPDYVPEAVFPAAQAEASTTLVPTRVPKASCPAVHPFATGGSMAAAEPPAPLPFDAKDASIESLLAAAWSCLDVAREDGGDGAKAKEAIRDWVEQLLTRLLVDSDRLSALSPTGAVERITLQDLARRAQSAKGTTPLATCRFDDFAINTAATARLIRALAMKGAVEGYCVDVDAIVEQYPSGCFWQPRYVPGEPHDRFTHETTIDVTPLGWAPRLAGTGFHVPVINVVAEELPECLERANRSLSPQIAAVVDQGWQSQRFPWIAEAETHTYGAHDLFFSDQHAGIAVAQGVARLGLAASGGPITVVAYGYGRGIDAEGAAPLDQATWLRNWSIGGGIEARLGVDRPIWLRELDIRLGVRGGYVGYHTPAAAPGLKDWEFLGSLSGWSLAYFPVGDRHGLWAEAGAAAYGGQATLWTVAQRALWLDIKVQAGARVFHVVEPYGMAVVRANFLQETDWDNNLRLGLGARLPLLYVADGPRRRFVLRLDGYWERTAAYWPWVAYVPSFRPLSDYRISLDAWFAWGGR